MTRAEQIEQAARAYLGNESEETAGELDAALALPPDPVPEPTERERALVESVVGYVIDVCGTAADSRDVDAATERAMRDFGDTHPRPAPSPTLRAWIERLARDPHFGPPSVPLRVMTDVDEGYDTDRFDHLMQSVGPLPAASEAGAVAAIVARLHSIAEVLRVDPHAGPYPSTVLHGAADAIEREHPEARALLLRVTGDTRSELLAVGDLAESRIDALDRMRLVDLAAIVDRALGGGR